MCQLRLWLHQDQLDHTDQLQERLEHLGGQPVRQRCLDLYQPILIDQRQVADLRLGAQDQRLECLDHRADQLDLKKPSAHAVPGVRCRYLADPCQRLAYLNQVHRIQLVDPVDPDQHQTVGLVELVQMPFGFQLLEYFVTVDWGCAEPLTQRLPDGFHQTHLAQQPELLGFVTV